VHFIGPSAKKSHRDGEQMTETLLSVRTDTRQKVAFVECLPSHHSAKKVLSTESYKLALDKANFFVDCLFFWYSAKRTLVGPLSVSLCSVFVNV
jgi:hypothetical protein